MHFGISNGGDGKVRQQLNDGRALMLISPTSAASFQLLSRSHSIFVNSLFSLLFVECSSFVLFVFLSSIRCYWAIRLDLISKMSEKSEQSTPGKTEAVDAIELAHIERKDDAKTEQKELPSPVRTDSYKDDEHVSLGWRSWMVVL